MLGTQGVQAEYARIPYADNTLRKIPDDLSDEDVLFTGDILSTGYTGVLRAGVELGDTIAVIGSGPVGLSAVACSKLFGTGLVIAVDVLDYRLKHAEQFGAISINASKEDPVEKIKEMTNGRGVDVGIEAAGFEETFNTCLKSTRRGGRVSVLGMFVQPTMFDISERFYDMFSFTIGLGELRHMNDLIKLTQIGRLDLKSLFTHRFNLSDAIEAYHIFENKLEDCIKVALKC